MEEGYRNFSVAIYCQVRDVLQMADNKWLEETYRFINKYIKFKKVYLETYRDDLIPKKGDLLNIKDFFEKKGIKASGGIAFVRREGGLSRTFCYTNPQELEMLKNIVLFTAEVFDEIILDDWFFTNCRCRLCTEAKGDLSWTEYRLRRLEEVARDYIIKPAKSVNPKLKLIIKYPNWYEHYQALGYNLDVETKIFDSIYTGTETRDPKYTQQHLQEYQSYLIMRYLENAGPSRNEGGWVDPYARGHLDRWVEQIQLTLFAKPREITLYCWGSLFETVKMDDGSEKYVSYVAPTAGTAFEETDLFMGKLGAPVGVPSYKPFNSSGEDFIHNYIGMLGIPLDLTPRFPENSGTVFLAESACHDPKIIGKIKDYLRGGKTLIVTSGLLKALQDHGFKDIVEIDCTERKIPVKEFMLFMDSYRARREIVVPELKYYTNDAWELVSGLSGSNGYPLLLQARYDEGTIYVLSVPDNFSDLYHLPKEVLRVMREIFMREFEVVLDSPSKICLFLYDNRTFIVKSFLPHATRLEIVVKKRDAKLSNALPRAERYFREFVYTIREENRTIFQTALMPHSHLVYKIE
ncbi:MAG: hypothetical protein QXN22_02160 [Thermofilaceae archaeon]